MPEEFPPYRDKPYQIKDASLPRPPKFSTKKNHLAVKLFQDKSKLNKEHMRTLQGVTLDRRLTATANKSRDGSVITGDDHGSSQEREPPIKISSGRLHMDRPKFYPPRRMGVETI